MKLILLYSFILLLPLSSIAQPLVSNVRAVQQPGTGLVDIDYDLVSPAGPCTVTLLISADGGASFNVVPQTVSGHIGTGITPGTGRRITWNAGMDWPGQYSAQMRFRVIADDGEAASAPVITSALTAQGRVGDAFRYLIEALGAPTLYSASGLPAGLSVDFGSGEITGTPSVANSYSVGVSAGNVHGSDNQVLQLTILPAIPVITSASSAVALQGQFFSHQITSTPVATRYEAVNIAPGLTLNSDTGLISGTPSLAGSYSTVLRAINAGGTGAQTWSLQVNLPPPPQITSSAAVSGVVDSVLYYQIQASNQPTTFSALGLPPGLTLNAVTGVISGTPTEEGTWQVALTAGNAGGTSAAFGLSISIGPAGSVAEGMVLVEGGTLAMSMGTRSVDSFYIGRYEVTWGEWKEVRTWAAGNGYDIGSRGDGCADDHPVYTVAWYDVVKWSNAKSEMAGLTPIYTVSGAVYRSGEPDHTTIVQNLSANGYRLPQEAEWEFAARGGNQTNGYTYSGSNDLNAVGWYLDNSGGAACNLWDGRGTWPVGQKAANELGLYDMSGNVWEWCWDQSGSSRRVRGGSWGSGASLGAVSARDSGYPGFRYGDSGFRMARSSGS